MRIVILGGDGYLGWPTAMDFAAKGHDVWLCDNYLRRNVARQTRSEPLVDNPNLHDRAEIWQAAGGKPVRVAIGDLNDWTVMERLFKEAQPEAVVHYAEQPSAPFSMMGREEAGLTLRNNIGVTFNLIWAVMQLAPECHIIKLGTMGEYGTPNIDIEEGWLQLTHNGRSDKVLFPRAAGSLYHTTKVLDTDLLWFYTRIHGLKVTDLMQGPVYGVDTAESLRDERLMPNFHYDDIFGTVLNRFLTQAVAGVPLTVYGKGGQTRGYLNIRDTLQCVGLALDNPVAKGEMRILNQFTEQFSVNQLAEKVRTVGERIGLKVEVNHIDNPRKEAEDHYYNAKHTGLLELGLKPHLLTDEVMAGMLETIRRYRDRIDSRKIMPRVRWKA